MKKTLFLLLALLMVGSGFAQKAPQTKLISSSEESIVVNFQLNGFSTAKVQTPEGLQYIVNVPEMAANLEAGAPELPTFPIRTIIGDLAEMTVNVIDAQYTDYNNMSIAPSKGNLSRQVNPDDVPYTYGEMYQQDAFWPAAQATLDAPYILRDFRGQNIVVRPFAYNPVTKTLRVYTNMTIAMTKVSDNGENPKVSRRSNTVKASPEFMASYERRFINFGEVTAKYPFIEDYGEMLIICADQFMAGMQPLVDWKNQSGRPTTMVSVTEVGGNTDSAIKNYITNLYNDPDHNLVYVLFVGDYEHITPHSLGSERSDNWFGQVEGTDHYPEVFIGRFSVQNDNHVNSQVTKVLTYERDTQANTTWGDKGMGIGYYGAGSGHFGEDDYQHIDRIRDTLLHYTYSEVTEHHGGSGGDASVATISGTTNEGISIINYCNHGSETSWGVANYSTSNVNTLVNDNMWPIVWSVACLNGKFNHGGANGECFAEAWMRATNNTTGVPTGAIGGMFSWMSQPWIPPMYGQDEMVNILCEWRSADQFNHTLAGASLNGNMDVIDKSGSSGYDTHDTWVLFGDPSLMVRTAIPTEMNVSANPSILMLGMSELVVNADANYAIATLSMNGEVLASGRIENGQCTLSFPALSNVGSAQLVVLGYNKVTSITEIEVVPAEGAFITVNDYVLSEQQANYGETLDMSINVKNVGVEVASNLTATLTTECSYVEILSNQATITEINPDEIVTVEGFQFSVAENVPDGTVAQFVLNVTDGTNEWESNMNIVLHAPVLAFESIMTSDNEVAFSFKNNGTAPFYGGVLNITSCSPDLTFDPETITYENAVEAGEILTLTASYTFAEGVEPGTTFEVAYDFTSGLFEIQDIFVVSYGSIMEDFESGVFGNDWTFSQANAWTIVDGGTKGTKCAKSMNNGINSSNYSMTLSVNVLADGNLTFDYRVSSEANYDKLFFYVDNVQMGEWSGTVDWTQFVQPVTVGQHNFKWEYSKDYSVNSGDDCAMVDNIIFPPTNVITFIAPATDLVAEVVGADVTLTWAASADADNYIVKRNGETIATVAETSYIDNLPKDGTYTYAIYAAKSEGQMSTPVSVTIVAEFDEVGEANETVISVYPNPTKNVLNIVAGNSDFEYSLVNGMGQEVVKGTAQGIQQINVSNMAKGVYFLRLTSGNQVNIQKIVVE